MVPRHFSISALISIVALVSSVPVAHAEGRKLAVVVGVDTYRANSGLPALKHASGDAASLSEALRTQGFSVYEMTHEAARKPGQESLAPYIANMRDQIDGVLGYPNLGRDDSVIITLHGHGVQFELVDVQGNKTPKFYFCPADATIAEIKSADEITERHHLLPLDELYDELAKCTAATKLLIVDACRNDPSQPGVFRAGLASATLPKLPPPTGGTAAFFSCKASQRAVEDPNLRQGVFTHFLVEGLNGAADQPLANRPADGIITFAELSAYVANNTYAHVFEKYKVKQSPELRGDYDLNLPLGRVVQTKPKAAGIEFVRIEPGTFMMGGNEGDDEKPKHRVTITKPFYAGKYEVTVGQALAWLNSGVTIDADWVTDGGDYSPVKQSGSRWVLNAESKFWSSPEQPMQNISWHGAVAFCEWCTQQDAKFTYRLPTEAEWEYMARTESTTAYPWGDSLNGREANVDGNFPYGSSTKGPYLEVTTKVGAYEPNAFGLYDTVGNVWEWCSDWYGADYYASSPERDPRGPSSGSSR
ncbi:MAG: SUMF1/EgtB/PvdO family nonheme iron enzyme, partial [Planctomycetaceae bacterium]|nr:SUMF1/EgtB/PvdO family nonheme iron enzyme [Planctomycetaceae bacterium]